MFFLVDEHGMGRKHFGRKHDEVDSKFFVPNIFENDQREKALTVVVVVVDVVIDDNDVFHSRIFHDVSQEFSLRRLRGFVVDHRLPAVKGEARRSVVGCVIDNVFDCPENGPTDRPQ